MNKTTCDICGKEIKRFGYVLEIRPIVKSILDLSSERDIIHKDVCHSCIKKCQKCILGLQKEE